MMLEGENSRKKKSRPKDDFTDMVLSWSLDDIFNENLYKNQVERIPDSFESVGNYFGSYVYPLLEETRAQLASAMEFMHQAPFAEVQVLKEAEYGGKFVYDVKVDGWRNRIVDHGKELYKVLPGDVLVVSDSKPESIKDLQRMNWSWTLASVTDINGEDIDERTSSTKFKVKTPEDMQVEGEKQNWLYVVYLTNILTSKRIWKALHRFKNLKLVEKVLCSNATAEEQCEFCSVNYIGQLAESFGSGLCSQLNESQAEAIRTSAQKTTCNQNSHVELIWGPPGTGKTKTVSLMLCILLRMNYRTLCCAPTNVAVKEVASRVVKLVKEAFVAESAKSESFAPLGEILLFGNKDRLKVAPDIEEIYLDYRVRRLVECLAQSNGLRHCVLSAIDLLEDGVLQYRIFLENEVNTAKENEDRYPKYEAKSFLEFIRERVKAIFPTLRRCLTTFCTHVPRSSFAKQNFENMVHLINLLESLEMELSEKVSSSAELEKLYSSSTMVEAFPDTVSLPNMRSSCLFFLKTAHSCLKNLGIPAVANDESIREFCVRMATLIFCTASTSHKLHQTNMEPLKVLVIDEAAQLKECESLIPLQLPDLRHAILIGDECQLPASVDSKVSANAAFGRSLFERLSLLGHFKHLLDVQYRMHPSISRFPNSTFYAGKIMDAPEVRSKKYERCFLEGEMFGPYSFIDVPGGKEDRDGEDYSWRNTVEAAVVVKIVQKLYKAWDGSNTSLSVGVISPYAAQVAVLQEKLRNYKNLNNFYVTVNSIDGFQGGEQDVILVSTVRANKRGSIGFLSSPQRTNVALTRARHCLWIFGNADTLLSKQSLWEALVHDAKDRGCFFSADEDTDVTKTIFDVKKELDQMEDLLNGDSPLFKQQQWTILFSNDFQRSFGKMTSTRVKKLVLHLLLSLASGWRPKKINVDLVCERSSQIVKHFKVDGFYVVCSIDIVKKSNYMQVLKVWDVLPLEEIPKLLKRLDNIFDLYTDDFIDRCKQKFLDGRAELPVCWSISSNITQYKSTYNGKAVADSIDSTSVGGCYAENSRVSESLLLMKFYSLSSGAVSHLLFNRDGGELDLPFEVTDEEWDIIQFPRSSFILGRSGTGKTTILTMKLFQKEQIYYFASEGYTTAESSMSMSVLKRTEFDHSVEETSLTYLRQLFVTVSPRLCHAVKQHVTRLMRSTRGGNFSSETSLNDTEDVEDIEQFKDIPDSFVGLPAKMYPLVITFNKFLMMLDGTIGDSYFSRFPEMLKIRDFSVDGNADFRSTTLQSLLRMKEVTYERFCFHYWPHFNSQLTKNLNASRVFTEIISHIKGGLLAGEAPDVKLSREEYVSMSNRRVSTMTAVEREMIYDVFLAYEKKKLQCGQFDLSDFVIDLHLRLKHKTLEGDKMDFVYIDEVQDLTMSQIALFKYICKNVDEGFVFSGDTAQTIARGIDFRFEDIRALFYNEFIMEAKSEECAERKDKSCISEIFNLHQNFRTHAGVLKLAQSVIDILCQFFPQSVDILKPEYSFIYGEAPVLLKPGSNRNAIEIIFGKTAKTCGKVEGFGAEQVILVRNDSAREKVSSFVGNHALVLTILECKGLEFQDVLLYDFFSSSPLGNQWRVVYSFMAEKHLLDSCSPRCFPSFSQSRHNILCSELKQLYVAITRTRQRLWICEDSEELSAPMFDFWKKLGLVQVKEVDESFAQTMLMASSPEEWKSRGIKLYREKKFQMASLCFERAGDTNWEKQAKAAGLRETADRMRASNPQEACIILRQAAELFDSIGRAQYAAECFYDLGDYKRAGSIYFDKCGDSKKAGDCFALAGSYKLAAQVYADGNYFLECLSVCVRGNLYELGSQYIEKWKQAAPCGNGTAKSEEIEKIEQEFLERCALSYYNLKDYKSMMKYVRAFLSIDLIRKFLKSISCLDELLLLEEELGNFDEAAEIAKLKGHYKRAGSIYFDKCGDSKKAGDCFALAGSYKLAAQVYADGNYFLECLSVCIRGNLYELGRQYIEKWKQAAKSEEIEKIDQEFLERCALIYYNLEDYKSMMKYVRAFLSIDLKRQFLKSISCLDELLLLEEELGNFDEAAEIAKLKGDLPREADILGKAGHLKEASLLILWFALPHSLWAAGNEGWPLRPFQQKQVLLQKALSFAQKESDELYKRVCVEVKVLLDEHISLNELHKAFTFSQIHKNLRVEMISIRRILDAHFDGKTWNFKWEDELLVDMKKHSEDMISLNHVSIVTLIYFWNLWKENMSNIMRHLECMENPSDCECFEYVEFCLNYFGVRRQSNNLAVAYILLNLDAEWVKNNGLIMKQRKIPVSIDAENFALAARSHCRQEVISVGLKVLGTLEAVYKFSVSQKMPLFCQGMCLIDSYQVRKFLTESSEFNDSVKRRLSSFLWPGIAYFRCVFPLDCSQSLVGSMISLRKTKMSRSLLEEVIVDNISNMDDLTYGQIGRVVMIWLGSGKPTDDLCMKIAKRIKKNSSWRAFIDALQVSSSRHALSEITESRSSGDPSSNTSGEDWKRFSLVDSFQEALRDTFSANLRSYDYISPDCFLYLVERLLVLIFHSKDLFFTTNYSFVEWLIYHQSDTYPDASSVADSHFSPDSTFGSVVMMVERFLLNKQETVSWISKSRIDVYQYHPRLTVRLVVILCLVHLNWDKCFNVLSHLLHQPHISSQLPRSFIQALMPRRKHNFTQDWFSLNAIADAFRKIGNPLTIVHLRENGRLIDCPAAVFCNTALTPNINDILRNLFPRKRNYNVQSSVVEANGPDPRKELVHKAETSTAISAEPSKKMTSDSGTESNLWVKSGLPDKIRDVLLSAEKRRDERLSTSSPNLRLYREELEESISFITRFQEELEKSTSFLTVGRNVKKSHPYDSECLISDAISMLDEIKQLTSQLDGSDVLQTRNSQEIEAILKSLKSKRDRLDGFLREFVPENQETDEKEAELEIWEVPKLKVKNDNMKASRSKHGEGNNKKNKKGGKGGRKK